MSETQAWEMLIDAHTGVFTTLRADGMPVALPVWFAVVDRQILVQTQGKKVDRLERDPRCSFLVEAGTAWAELRAVHITGRAERIQASGDLAARFRAEMGRKYEGSRTRRTDMPERAKQHYGSGMSLVRIMPDAHLVSWDNRLLRKS